MSDNIPLDAQRACTDGEYYNLDLFSYVQPPVYGNSGSLNQLIMYITRALENSDRLAFMQVWKFLMHKKTTDKPQQLALTSKLNFGQLRKLLVMSTSR